MEEVASKSCVRCKVEKPLTEFHKAAKGKLGRNSKCIPCTKEIRYSKLGVTEISKHFAVIKNGIPYKTCRDCKEEKHLKYFLHSSNSGRKSPICRKCNYFKKAKAYERNGVIFKHCKDCLTHKPISEYSLNTGKMGYFGRRNVCKGCMRIRYAGYRSNYPELATERSRKWREANPEKAKESKRNWYSANTEKSRAEGQRRRARLRQLDNSLTALEWKLTCEIFENKCALTGEDDISMDHFIPVSAGSGGTNSLNVYPLSKKLNFSKNDKNPFEWFAQNKVRFGLQQEKFDRLVGVLAALNCMRIAEFTAYVYSAFGEDHKHG